LRIIELDAARWRSASDFYDDLLAALGAPDWHGRNFNALIDSMIWGGINAVEPPYLIRVVNAAVWPRDVQSLIEGLREALPEQRAEFRRQKGWEPEVELEIRSGRAVFQ
jgi:RNAse (barnase) inhibitor barstar